MKIASGHDDLRGVGLLSESAPAEDVTEFLLRPGKPEDLPFVYASVARSLRSSPHYRSVASERWTSVVNDLVDRMLVAPWGLTVAHPRGFPDEIAGFVLGKRATPLTFEGSRGGGQDYLTGDHAAVGVVYTKEAYRNLGVARQLVMSVTEGHKKFLIVMAAARTVKRLRENGCEVELSPYLV